MEMANRKGWEVISGCSHTGAGTIYPVHANFPELSPLCKRKQNFQETRELCKAQLQENPFKLGDKTSWDGST